MTSSTVFHHIRKLAIWASGKSNRHSATFNYIWFYSLILSSLGLPGIQAPEGLHAKFDDLWQLCRDHPDIQAMLDEAVRGKQGRPSKPKEETVYNINSLSRPVGTSRASGIRKLRKYAQERPDVAEAFEKVLAHS